MQVPPTLKFVMDGEMPDYLLAKDLILQVSVAYFNLQTASFFYFYFYFFLGKWNTVCILWQIRYSLIVLLCVWNFMDSFLEEASITFEDENLSKPMLSTSCPLQIQLTNMREHEKLDLKGSSYSLQVPLKWWPTNLCNVFLSKKYQLEFLHMFSLFFSIWEIEMHAHIFNPLGDRAYYLISLLSNLC